MSLDVLPHLKRFVEQHLATHGRRNSRQYLRDNIDHWRQHYGDNVADHMQAHIRGLYERAQANR